VKIFARSTQPAGIAEATGGTWRVSGRWPSANGRQHADWMVGFCVMKKRGQPLLGEDGRPLIRGVFLPARDWQIEDTARPTRKIGHATSGISAARTVAWGR